MSESAPLSAGGPDPGAVGVLMTTLFERHGRMVYGLCRLLLRDPVEAEDAAQQTFLSAHGAILGGSPPRDARAWLSAIARNECRARIARRMREPLPLQEELVGGGATPHDVASRTEEMAELKLVLRQLPVKQREAVVLRDVFGLGYREIAVAIGASVPAVETLLVRGRRKIQGRLRPLRDAAAGLAVPDSLRESLLAAIPGFGASGTSAAWAVAAGGGLAKFGAPAAAKIAAATLAVGAAGTVAVQQTGAPARAVTPSPGEASIVAPVALGRPAYDVQLAAAMSAKQEEQERADGGVEDDADDDERANRGSRRDDDDEREAAREPADEDDTEDEDDSGDEDDTEDEAPRASQADETRDEDEEHEDEPEDEDD